MAVTAKRPILLWLAADELAADNVSDPDANNQPVSLSVTSDGLLEISIKTNYDYELVITTETEQTYYFGQNTQLEWHEFAPELIPPGEQVDITLSHFAY